MTRRAQPYRRMNGPAGPTLTAMLKGAPFVSPEPDGSAACLPQAVRADQRPYFAQIRRRDSDSAPVRSERGAGAARIAGWQLVMELLDQAHGDAARRLLFAHAGAEGRVLEQAEYARLLGFLSGSARPVWQPTP
jgi:hypothetical protein